MKFNLFRSNFIGSSSSFRYEWKANLKMPRWVSILWRFFFYSLVVGLVGFSLVRNSQKSSNVNAEVSIMKSQQKALDTLKQHIEKEPTVKGRVRMLLKHLFAFSEKEPCFVYCFAPSKNYYLQALLYPDVLDCEMVSNSSLADEHKLSVEQNNKLSNWGWEKLEKRGWKKYWDLDDNFDLEAVVEDCIQAISLYPDNHQEKPEIDAFLTAIEWRYALMIFAYQGDIEAIQGCIQDGTDINMVNDSGRTALMCAADNGHTEIIKLLLDNGASVDTVDHSGRTAFDYAVISRNEEAIKMLQ